MKIAVLHNLYQHAGGEDAVVVAEVALLRAHGHLVSTHLVQNTGLALRNKVALAKNTIWNSAKYSELRAAFRTFQPDIVHVHNTLPLLSPSVYLAARSAGAAVVQTLHNFRMSCVNGIHFRNGRVCEACLGRAIPWQGVVHGCYRSSRSASAVVAVMLGYHKARGTYRDMVDAYISPSNFALRTHIAAGVPSHKVRVKPHFLSTDPGVGRGNGGYALFVGRISAEKGIATLLSAWEGTGGRLPLRIVGEGPLKATLAHTTRQPGVCWLGQLPAEGVYEQMGGAQCLVVPAESHETFGRVVVEAFATGTPVIAADSGAVAELVQHGKTGLVFQRGNPMALASTVDWVLRHPAQLAEMRSLARAEYLRKYTAEVNYASLMEVYKRALETSARESDHTLHPLPGHPTE